MKYYFYFSFGVSVLALVLAVFAFGGSGKPFSDARGASGGVGAVFALALAGLVLIVIVLNGLIASGLALRSGVGGNAAWVSLVLHGLPIVIGVIVLIGRGLEWRQSELQALLRSQMRGAVESGDVSRVSELLAQGQSPDLEGRLNTPLLHIAAENADVEMMRLLIEAKAEHVGGAMVHAARSGQARAVEFLLGRGVDADDPARGGTPLMDATSREVAQVLVEAGADIQAARNYDAKTVLMQAVFNERREIVVYLLAQGADVHATDDQGRSALHYARYKDSSIIKALLEHGADPGVTDAKGDTALMEALAKARSGSHEALGVLIDAGVSQANDKTNAKGQTAMMIAMGKGRTEAVMHLLDAGARADVVDGEGNNVLHYLARYKGLSEVMRRSIVERLSAAGVSLAVGNKAGQTPYDVALESKLGEAHRALFKPADVSVPP